MLAVKIEYEGLTKKEEEKILKAVNKMELALNSDYFQDWCLNFSWEEKICTGSLWWKKCRKETRKFFHYNQGLTNYQVYISIMNGKEVLNGELDNEADIILKVDRSGRSCVGYTYPSKPIQYIMSWVLKEYSIDKIAGNLAHEWCHKLGYKHEKESTAQRKYSIPYAIGYFVRDF